MTRHYWCNGRLSDGYQIQVNFCSAPNDLRIYVIFGYWRISIGLFCIFLYCLTDSAPLHVITLCPETVFIVVSQTFHVNLSSLDVNDSHTNTLVYKYIFQNNSWMIKKVDDLLLMFFENIYLCEKKSSTVSGIHRQ